MTFQSSGPAYISAVGTEAGLSLPYYGRDAAIRTLCGTGTGTLHLLADAYGKSLAAYANFGTLTVSEDNPGVGFAEALLQIGTDGDLESRLNSTTYGVIGPSWLDGYYEPTTAGIGSSSWVRFTKISGSVLNAGAQVGFTEGVWYSLASLFEVGLYVNRSVAQGYLQLNSSYTVDISSSSSGTPIVATGTVNFHVSSSGGL